MTTAQKHATRTYRRLQRRGPDGEVRLTYPSARTARKAEQAMRALDVPVLMTWVGRKSIEYRLRSDA